MQMKKPKLLTLEMLKKTQKKIQNQGTTSSLVLPGTARGPLENTPLTLGPGVPEISPTHPTAPPPPKRKENVALGGKTKPRGELTQTLELRSPWEESSPAGRHQEAPGRRGLPTGSAGRRGRGQAGVSRVPPPGLRSRARRKTPRDLRGQARGGVPSPGPASPPPPSGRGGGGNPAPEGSTDAAPSVQRELQPGGSPRPPGPPPPPLQIPGRTRTAGNLHPPVPSSTCRFKRSHPPATTFPTDTRPPGGQTHPLGPPNPDSARPPACASAIHTAGVPRGGRGRRPAHPQSGFARANGKCPAFPKAG
ncbi:proline-rich protein 2-like [Dipodomys spectabilis]|uniref:proline-rich protein 2-like n=1 Tax=Dipodomys spectabilis TaxID=105255 RepID=UPI001C537FA0|nr:proline-rich protein 2-like [Dipodomys spectabilis]